MAIAELDQPPSPRVAPIRLNRAAPSVTAELFWGVRNVAKADTAQPLRHDAGLVTTRRLPSRVRSFWADGMTCFTELFVLAARAGCLDGDDPAALLRAIGPAARLPLEARMLSTEDAGERSLIITRLEVLRTDSRVRSTYGRLLDSVWETQDASWRGEGCALVGRSARAWQAEIERGASPALVAHALPAAGCREELAAMAEEAAGAGRLLASPTYFGSGFCVVDAGPATILASPADRDNRAASLRAAARAAVGRYKALSDPTRVAVLALLHDRPATIGEIARRLEISQPTVSAHFSALRAAGLVRELQEGRTVRYSLDGARLDAILDEVRGLVLEGAT